MTEHAFRGEDAIPVQNTFLEQCGETTSTPDSLHDILHQIHVAAVSLDCSGRIIYCNPAFLDLAGFTLSELIGQEWFDNFVPEDAREEGRTSFNAFLQGSQNESRRRNPILNRQGEVRLLEWSNVLLHDTAGLIVGTLGFGEDITEHFLAVEAQRAGEATKRSVFDGLTAHIALMDSNGVVVEVNNAWRNYEVQAAPFCHEILPGENYLQCCTMRVSDVECEESVVEFIAGLQQVFNGTHDEFVHEFSVLRPGGPHWFLGRVTRICRTDEVERVPYSRAAERIVVTFENVTERKVAEERLRQTNAILEATQEAAEEGIFLVDDRGLVVRFNRRFTELWGIAPEKVDALRDEHQLLSFVLDSLMDADEFIEKIGFLYDNPSESTRDEIYLKDGRVFDRYSAPAISPNGQYYGRVWSFSDITERKASEARLAHQAFHDVLTGLPNRALFSDRLARALSRAKRHNTYIAVLFLDLDRFKIINDSLGHDAGDQLLAAVANRLRARLRPEDTAARLGGDEFTILMEDITDVAHAAHIADRIAEDLRTPFKVGQHEIFTTSSIGIALSDGKSHRADELMRNADAAMYEAKAHGRAKYEIFDDRLTALALEHLELENDLRRALERGEFEVHYQPIVSLPNQQVVSQEALLRWRHPVRGMVSPDKFISLAEETGLIVPIGKWVLLEACRQARRWQLSDTLRTEHSISINLSPRQFEQPDLVPQITQILRETDLHPSCLILEITESVMMRDVKTGMNILTALKRLGVRLAVDDFGTGYSSLSYLKKFPIDNIKLDRSFIAGLGSSCSDRAIVQAVVTLAQTLGVFVTAEGIETMAQYQDLLEIKCALGQGYLFAKPQPDCSVISRISPLMKFEPAS
jgi:diguanylate cyclase (GGDEF)-like protein/PAS domain S-box-containing protein